MRNATKYLKMRTWHASLSRRLTTTSTCCLSRGLAASGSTREMLACGLAQPVLRALRGSLAVSSDDVLFRAPLGDVDTYSKKKKINAVFLKRFTLQD